MQAVACYFVAQPFRERRCQRVRSDALIDQIVFDEQQPAARFSARNGERRRRCVGLSRRLHFVADRAQAGSMSPSIRSPAEGGLERKISKDPLPSHVAAAAASTLGQEIQLIAVREGSGLNHSPAWRTA